MITTQTLKASGFIKDERSKVFNLEGTALDFKLNNGVLYAGLDFVGPEEVHQPFFKINSIDHLKGFLKSVSFQL